MAKRCAYCFTQLDNNGKCPHCFKTQPEQTPQNTLPIGAVIDNRFIIGALLHQDGEGCEYAAYDEKLQMRVLLREFFPTALSVREADFSISIVPGKEILFKNVLTAFVDLYKTLNELEDCPALQEIYGLYKYGNTVYASMQYFEGNTLSEILANTLGDIDDASLLELLKPVFQALVKIHAKGMIHGGICPDNILISPEGQVCLCHFATSSLRTANTELESELYDGYTSPEQYTITGWQGPWTDVFGISATLYRCLTGTRPRTADHYAEDTDMIPVARVCTDVDPRLSLAIARGMQFSYKKRIQSIEEFAEYVSGQRTEQPEEPKDNKKADRGDTRDISATTRQVEPAEKAGDTPKKAKNKKKIKLGKKQKIAILAAVLALIIIGAVAGAVALTGGDKDPGKESTTTEQEQGETEEEEEETKMITVPAVVGMQYEAFSTSSQYQGEDYNYQVTYIYSDVYDEGVICGISPSEGEEVEAGTVIQVQVSKGEEKTQVPEIIGKTQAEAEKALSDAGISYEVLAYYVSGTPGTVVKYETDGASNSEVIASKEKVYLYVVTQTSDSQ